MFNDLIFRAVSKSNTRENLTLTTTGAAAVSDSLSTLTASTMKDALIQNTSAAACYIDFGTSAVTATSSSTYLPANSSLSLETCEFTFFSVIRVAGDVTVRITGIGRIEP